MDNQVQQVVVRCKDCGQKNRVLESAVHGTYGCGKCGAVLPVPFRYLVLDSETTGLPSRRHVPHLVQLAWSVHASDGTLLAERNYIVRPDGYSVPQASTRIHGITDEQARRDGVPLRHVLDAFLVEADSEGVRLVAHNMAFDSAIMKGELERIGRESTLDERPGYCTMRSTVDLCRIPRRGGGYDGTVAEADIRSVPDTMVAQEMTNPLGKRIPALGVFAVSPFGGCSHAEPAQKAQAGQPGNQDLPWTKGSNRVSPLEMFACPGDPAGVPQQGLIQGS